MHHVHEFEIFDRDFGFVLVNGAHLGGTLRERDTELVYFFQCHIRASKQRQTAHHTSKRTHEVKRGDDIAGERFRAELGNLRQQKENQTNEREEKKVAPILRRDESHLSADVMLLKG